MTSHKGSNTLLHCILRHCGEADSAPRARTPQCRSLQGWLKSGPRFSGLMRLVFGPFRLAIFLIGSETIENKSP